MDKETKVFLEEKFASIDQRFVGMEKTIAELPSRTEVENIVDRKIDGLAQMVQAGLTDLSDRMNTRFDEVDSRLRALELSLFTDYNSRIEKLEQTVEKLKLATGLS